MKKCPVCTSTRVVNTRNGMHCKRCGYFMYNPNKNNVRRSEHNEK
jgi:tRNA(Ile2) C34 agmatinyltransferase TiaS